MTEPWRRALLAAVAFGALGLTRAGAEPIDPTVPTRRVVGPPAGSSPMWRVDGARTGRSSDPLPDQPKVLWRARISGGLDLAPVVDRRGRVIVASPGGRLVELDARGKAVFTAKTGSASAVLGPVLTSDGTRIVVSATGELWGIGNDGRPRVQTSLPLGSFRGGAQPLATSDGGLVLALTGALLRLDSRGSVQARARFLGTPTAVLEDGARVLVVTTQGEVSEWKPPAEPTELGTFGGQVAEGAALSSPVHVTAVVDQKRVVDFNLRAGTRHVRVDSTELLQGPPAITAAGETRVAAFSGLMLGHDRLGSETTRVALEPAGLPAAAQALAGYAVAPALLVDGSSRVAFVRPGLDAGVVAPDGSLQSASGAACGDPLALVPAGKHRMLLACRSGLLVMIGQLPRSSVARR